MNLRKLPPSMLLTLGLACGDGKSSDETTTVNACLSPIDPTAVETTPCLSTTGMGNTSDVDTGPCLDVGPCLSESTGFGTSGSSSGTGGSTFGPCLSPEPATGTSTDTGSGTDTGTDTDGTTGMMAEEPPTSRAAALERVLDRGTLPADVAARLRDRVR